MGSQLIDTCTRIELSYVCCMITEKEKSHNNGHVPLLAFILQVGLGLYFCIMDNY